MAASHTSLRTAAHALVEALEAHGVEVAFGIPGQHALALWDALESSSIRTVVVRHEQAASFAAVGYARTSDRVGVCITSTGPGAFNTFAGMGEADASSLVHQFNGSDVDFIETDLRVADGPLSRELKSRDPIFRQPSSCVHPSFVPM